MRNVHSAEAPTEAGPANLLRDVKYAIPAKGFRKFQWHKSFLYQAVELEDSRLAGTKPTLASRVGFISPRA